MRGILRPSAVVAPAGPDRVARVHRTTTTATLLVTVAVSALAGCVTVQRPAAHGSSPVPARPSVPRPEGSGAPRIVQAPASEALGLVGPPRTPAPSKTPAATSPPATAPASPGPAAPRHVPPPRAGTPQQPRTRPEDHRRRREEPLRVPEPTRSVTGNADVCALGRAYGGWPADSPQATICRDAYGR